MFMFSMKWGKCRKLVMDVLQAWTTVELLVTQRAVVQHENSKLQLPLSLNLLRQTFYRYCHHQAFASPLPHSLWE
jgi:hypothetical protein